MADINIEKKENTPIWPWILGILALLVILALVFWPSDDAERRDNMDRDTTGRVDARSDNAAQPAGTVSQPVQAYITWAQASAGEMGIDHEYTHDGLDKMTAAIASIAQQTKDVDKQEFQDQFNKIEKKADNITHDPNSTEHADMIIAAFKTNTNLLEEVQESSFPDMEGDVDKIEDAVEKLQASTLTLEQKDEVKNVFRQIAEVLERMDRSIDS